MKLEEIEHHIAGIRFMKPDQGRLVYDFVIENNLGHVLELGFAHGKSTCYFAAAADEIGGDAHVVTIDRQSSRQLSPNIDELLDRCGLAHRVTPVFAEASYTWELMKLIQESGEPRFDFAYIDAGHTWDVTGYGFFLVDILLKPGGWLLFDDLDWTLAGSKVQRNKPHVKELPEDQRTSRQVRKVFELLVRPHPGYTDFREHDGWGWARKRPARRRGLLRRHAAVGAAARAQP